MNLGKVPVVVVLVVVLFVGWLIYYLCKSSFGATNKQWNLSFPRIQQEMNAILSELKSLTTRSQQLSSQVAQKAPPKSVSTPAIKQIAAHQATNVLAHPAMNAMAQGNTHNGTIGSATNVRGPAISGVSTNKQWPNGPATKQSPFFPSH